MIKISSVNVNLLNILDVFIFSNLVKMSADLENDEEGCVVKMRGLPWSTTVEEIIKFFGK